MCLYVRVRARAHTHRQIVILLPRPSELDAGVRSASLCASNPAETPHPYPKLLLRNSVSIPKRRFLHLKLRLCLRPQALAKIEGERGKRARCEEALLDLRGAHQALQARLREMHADLTLLQVLPPNRWLHWRFALPAKWCGGGW